MIRKLSLLVVIVFLVSVIGASQLPVTPRTVGVLLFDNETGVAVTKLVIIFDQPITLDASQIIAFGGGKVTSLNQSGQFALVKVSVVAGGTLQIALPEGAKVKNAYWFN